MGIIQQINEPVEIYERPENMFVAGFIGSPAINFLPGPLKQLRHYFSRETDLNFQSRNLWQTVRHSIPGRNVVVGIRPEHFSIPHGEDGVIQEVDLEVVEPMGHETYNHFSIGSAKMTARIAEGGPFSVGSRIKLLMDISKAHYFDQSTGVVLRG